MSNERAVASQVLVFSPPKRKDKREINPSDFLLLKPFSKAPHVQIDVPVAGESRAALLTVQNIDDNPSRLYFEIPTDKNIVIRPSTSLIKPQSVETFEVVAIEPKESLRAVIKVYAPDIKYYKGGQFSVTVSVKKVLNTEKKKRKPKPALPALKPKAVTVPEEFTFQPSREERKKKGTCEKAGQVDNEFNTGVSIAETTLGIPEISSTDLEQIRRQTAAFKQIRVVNQTYSVVPPPMISLDFNDPLTFITHELGTSRSIDDVPTAVMKYAEHAKVSDPASTSASVHQREVMNTILMQHMESLANGDVTAALTHLRDALRSENAEIDRERTLVNDFSNVRISEESQASRSPRRTTSSPKQSERPAGEFPGSYNYLRESLAKIPDNLAVPNGSFVHSSMKELNSPDVSAIFSVSRLS